MAIARLFLEIAKYCQSWFVLFSKSIKIEFYNLVIFLIRLSEFNENMNMGSNKSLLLSKFTKHFIAFRIIYQYGYNNLAQGGHFKSVHLCKSYLSKASLSQTLEYIDHLA